MSELKPCPFCGGEDIEIVHCEEGCCGAKPRLMECKCGCSLWVSAQNDNEAIATWNTRPNDAKAMIAEGIKLLKPSDYVDVRTYLASPMGISLVDVEEVIKALGRVCEADSKQSSEGE